MAFHSKQPHSSLLSTLVLVVLFTTFQDYVRFLVENLETLALG